MYTIWMSARALCVHAIMAAAVVCAIPGQVLAAPASEPPCTATLDGHVVDEATHHPIAGARVQKDGTAVALTDTMLTAQDVHTTGIGGDITCSNAVADAVTFFTALRDISADTLSDDLLIIGLKVYYNMDNENDD